MFSRALRCTALILGVASIASCGALDVSDPTAIEESELQDATGANLLRIDALRRLYGAVGVVASISGMFSDEFFTDTPSYYPDFGLVNAYEFLDRRDSEGIEEGFYSSDLYTQLQDARRAATLAMPGLRKYVSQAKVGEMFMIRGFAEIGLAENVCPGFPLHDVVDYKPVYGDPLTTDDVFERALMDFDSALAYAADSARILNGARIGRARALLALGRATEAAATVTAVPTVYTLNAEYSSAASQWNPLGDFIHGERRSVAEREGTTGLDFLSANDRRVQYAPVDPAEDGTPMYSPTKYSNEDLPVVMASGIEARLIEAEAALNAGGDWLGILNDLRADQIIPALPDTTDPGTEAARVDLLFRERAFWLFATGHRLGDLRRLMDRYGRAQESLFPTGAYRLDGTYETATSIPFPAALETPFNPAVTGCQSR